MSNIVERDGPEVRSLAQSLIRHIVCGVTEAVDFEQDMVIWNSLWDLTFDYYRLIGILTRRRLRVTEYQVFHLLHADIQIQRTRLDTIIIWQP